jgi:hypothetical protein
VVALAVRPAPAGPHRVRVGHVTSWRHVTKMGE